MDEICETKLLFLRAVVERNFLDSADLIQLLEITPEDIMDRFPDYLVAKEKELCNGVDYDQPDDIPEQLELDLSDDTYLELDFDA